MTPPSLLPRVEEYLAYRRGLGFALETPAWLLRDFARHVDRCGHRGPLTIELATGWALSSRSADPAQPARRLAAVRQFARYLALSAPATEVPPAGLLGRVPHRRQAHIYSEAELTALLREASLLLPRRGLRPKTYVTFFSLLATTGLRLSEGCRLERSDVDLDAGVLRIRESKFRKSRLVPLHPTATDALRRYTADRDAHCGAAGRGRFFRTERCPVLTPSAVEKTFARIRRRLRWGAEGRTARPRIQDLRHYADSRIMPTVAHPVGVSPLPRPHGGP
ncbi:MAG: tyrosine-type recombinase/integrase [Thermoleophilia bacterium]|nr:tyrosine-type recombinase/integrase [Thermoleophilia bacterium]